MTTSNDGFHGVAYGKFRKKVLPHDQPAISITNSNPNNTSKSGFLSRLIYLVTCAFWKRNPEEAPVTANDVTYDPSQPACNVQGQIESKKFDSGRSRSSVLYDLGSGGPMHKFGPKSYFVPSKRLLLRSSQPLLINLKGQIVNGKQACRKSGYSFVPAQSTQRHIIREHLERTSPKEKNSSSRVAGTTEKSANDYDCMSSTIREIASKLLI
ncbi:hypothetical protein Tco_1087294 [Tanacetum coccineum]